MNFIRNNKLLIFTFLLVVIFLTACEAKGQKTTELFRTCPGAAPSPAKALVQIEKDGDINLVPCATKAVFINGASSAGLLSSLNGLTAATQLFAVAANDTASFSSATATHTLRLPITAISGSSRTNFFPFFDAANTFAKSPFSWNGTGYAFNNTALNANWRLEFIPNDATGSFTVGDAFATPTNYFELIQGSSESTISAQTVILGDAVSQASGTSIAIDALADSILLSDAAANSKVLLNFNTNTFEIDSGAGITTIGDISGAGNSTLFSVNDATQRFTFEGDAVGVFDVDTIQNFLFYRTLTTGGTTGNQTISKPVGSVNFAAGASALTVTSTIVTANSLIIAIAQTNDATCSVKNVVAGAGSFVINMTANCTAETRVAFLVTN